MRNLKKFLALVLAMVMAFSLMLSASAAADTFDKYGDKDQITDEFKEAVQVLSGLDVFGGDDRGFAPADTITRAEAAAVVYRVATGDVTNAQTALYADYNHFADVNKSDWFAGYVGFCQNAGIIKGTTPTTFSPYLKVTGYEMLAMLLRVVGYGKNNEFTGSSWQVNTAAMAESLHITDTVKEANFSSTLNMAARRDVVAELTFRTMVDVPTVTYSTSMQYNDRDTLLATMKNPTLGQKIFGLFRDDTVDAIDEWGRPGYYWAKGGVQLVSNSITVGVTTDRRLYDTVTLLPIYGWKTGNASTTANKSLLIATIKDEALKIYHTKTIECDIAHDLEWTADKTISSAYIDGVKVPTTGVSTDSKAQIAPLDTTNYLGGHGRILEIYDMSLGNKRVSTANQEEDIRVVEINTYLAQVNKVSAAGEDKNQHPYKAKIDLLVHSGVGDYHSSTNQVTRNAQAWADLNWHTKSHNVQAVDTNEHTPSHEIWDFDGITVENADYTVGQCVLVYVNKANQATTVNRTNNATIKESYIRKAEVKQGGFVMSWTDCAGTNPDKTMVGTTNYEDSDKFCLNWRVKNVPYSVVVDEYGYAIGLVNLSQFLVIEKIEWKQSDTIGGGYALMDAVTSGGEKITGVKVSSFNNMAPVNSGDSYGAVSETDIPSTPATVSDFYTNNKNFYTHIYSYDVDADGSYALRHNCKDRDGGTVDASGEETAANQNKWLHNGTNPNVSDPTAATITKGEATIKGTVAGNINSYVATDNTVFAVMNADGYTYTTYVGKNNVPSITNANLCVVTSNGYANMVVVRNGNRLVRSDVFSIYVPSLKPVDGKYINGTYCYGYDVYKVDDGTQMRIYENKTNAGSDMIATNVTKTGFYRVVLDANNQVQTTATGTATPNAITGGFNDDNILNGSVMIGSGIGTTWDDQGGLIARQRIQNVVSGYSIQTSSYGAITVANTDTTSGFNSIFAAGKNFKLGQDYPNGYIVDSTAGNDRDFSLSADTKVYKVNTTITTISGAYHIGRDYDRTNTLNDAAADVSVTAGDMSDLTPGSIVWVYYTTKTDPATLETVYTAPAIYVLNLNTVAAPSTAATINVTLNVKKVGSDAVNTFNAGSYKTNSGVFYTYPTTAATLKTALGTGITADANNYLSISGVLVTPDTASIASVAANGVYSVTYNVLIP